MGSFAERLQEERKRLELSQDEFGMLAGVSRKSQSGYEIGARYPDAGYLIALHQNGVDTNYLISGDRETANGSINLREEIFLSFDAYEVVSKRLKKYDISIEKKKEAAWLLYQIYKENESPDERMVDSVISLLEG